MGGDASLIIGIAALDDDLCMQSSIYGYANANYNIYKFIAMLSKISRGIQKGT